MPSVPDTLISYLRSVSGAWRDDPRDDAELLTRYAETRDETAFRSLIWRHGLMVWQSCKRVLGDGPDAEDAFQSAFLALARKADRLRREPLAGWLHKVARQAALNIDATTQRRRSLEQRLQTTDVSANVGHAELYAELDKELVSLPDRLRIPLVLRYLEGKTLEDVARIVGCSRPVVSKRLARGEARLRTRLEQRGLTLGAMSIAALLGSTGGASAVPVRLIESTSRAAVAFRAGSLTGASAEAAEKLLRALADKGGVRTYWWAMLATICSLSSFGAGVAIWKMVTIHSNAVNAPAAQVVEPASSVVTCPSRVDVYGDPLPEGALARLGTVRLRNTEVMFPLSFMPDGKAVVSASLGYLLMWEFPSGKRLRSLGSFKDAEGFAGYAISADGKLMAIATQNGDVKFLDSNTGKQVGHLNISPKDKENALIDPRALAFSPDGKTLVSGMRDKTVRFWNVATGKEIRRQKLALASPGLEIKEMAFTPDTLTMAVGQGNGLVRLFDLKSGASTGDIKVKISKKQGEFISLAFSADSRKLAATGSDGWITLWDVASCKSLLQVKGCEGLQTLRLSPDRKILAAWGNEEKNGKVHLWNAETGASLVTLTGPQGFACCMAFSPDSKVLVTGTLAQTVKLWDVSTGKLLQSQKGHEFSVNAVAFSPDGKSLVSANGTDSENSPTPILIWDIKTCKPRRQQVDFEPGERLEGALTYAPKESPKAACITYSSDGALLASPGKDKDNRDVVWLWDANTGKRLRTLKGLIGDQKSVSVVAFASDNKTLAMGDYGSETIELCDIITGKRLRSLRACDLEDLQGTGVMALVFSADGLKLASVHPSRIAIWDATTGKQLHSLVIPLQGESRVSVSSVAFSPDGRFLVSGGEGDTTLRLWEVASGQELLKIPLEYGGIKVAFSPEGRLIASANEDETVRLWDVITGRQLHQFSSGQGRVRSIVFSPDGKTLASGNQDTTVLLWDVAPWIKKEKRPTTMSQDEIQAAWSALADADASKAFRAFGRLVEASDQAVPLLAEQLRSTAMTSQSAAAIHERVVRLLADLDSDDFQVRNHSRGELQKMEAYEAEPILRHALKGGSLSPEQRQSVVELLDKWNVNGLPPKFLRRLRGVATLEYIGTDAARQVLQELAKAPVCDGIADEARASLQRLNQNTR